jgi:alkanesulfonate monooxygenase SsuD/methylene tetrahydromethanopterin reductase-like flavin-dependent oxidoreductase (luciferase family)
MRIGVTVPAQATFEATVAGFELAEGLGVGSAWFPQPPGGFDALTVLALAAGRTRSVRLGTAVIPTFPHHPLVTARAVRTVAAAAPGGVVLGVSSGHRTWIEHGYGLRFDRPVRQITEWIATVRRLLRGEALSASDNAFGINVAGSGTQTEVPIVLAATGPRMLGAADRVADGVLAWMCDETYLGEVVLPAMARGAEQAAKAAPPLVAGVLVCVCDDAGRARAGLRPRLAPLGGIRLLPDCARPPRADAARTGGCRHRRDGSRSSHGVRPARSRGVSEVVAVVLPDPADPTGSAQRAHRLLAALVSEFGPRLPAGESPQAGGPE